MSFEKHYRYVFGAILAQSGPCKENRFSYRIVAGVWVLAALVFVQAYQSTLITYVIVPVTTPLINSVYDLAESTDINFIVKKGGLLEYLFKSSNKTVYQKLQTRIDASPRCVLTSDCIAMITPGSRNVYADAKTYLKHYVEANFKRTGKCNIQIARDDFFSVPLSYVLPKHSPHTNTLSIGVLEFQQYGLRRYWELLNRPAFSHCQAGRGKTPKNSPALSLKNLTGAFVVLLIGTSLSLLSFIHERITCMANRHHK